jgi:hypothetical protein
MQMPGLASGDKSNPNERSTDYASAIDRMEDFRNAVGTQTLVGKGAHRKFQLSNGTRSTSRKRVNLKPCFFRLRQTVLTDHARCPHIPKRERDASVAQLIDLWQRHGLRGNALVRKFFETLGNKAWTA